MQKISSQFKRGINNATSNISIVNNSIENLILRALALIYVVILGNMVRNIVARRSLEANANSLSSEVGNLELSYLSLSNNIDLAYSYSLGFKETKATFATRKSLGMASTPLDNTKIAQNDL